uniref:TAR DNA-binding protein 43 N-terminal domain-containing protein n=1 Tax=Ascaris lumbricoides TaxID=6252 RepID=A0A9J2PVI7_ASCLU
MDDPPGNVDGDPPTGWVRLQLEPVDVPLEADESLLLSTVQSAIPGAHGLYYKEGSTHTVDIYNEDYLVGIHSRSTLLWVSH